MTQVAAQCGSAAWRQGGGARGLEVLRQLVAEEMDEGWTYPRELQWWPLCVLLWNYSESRKVSMWD